MSSAPTVSPDVEPDWNTQLASITAYVEQHDGRFPPNRSDDPRVTEMGCWWVAQNISMTQDKMSAGRRTRLAALREFAEELRARAKARHAAQVAAQEGERSRARSAAAGRAAAVAAVEALKSPYLVPGDAEVLQLRIDHPVASLAELAALAGLTKGRFETKYYGALNRGPRSRSPLKKDLKDRLLAPGEAADTIGVSRVVLARWTDAGLVHADRNRQGHRRYLGAEVLRVKGLIGEGWPAEFRAAGDARPSRRR